MEYLQQGEINQVLKSIHEPRDYAIVMLFLSTGLFLTEATELTVSDIDWDAKTIAIKGKRSRTIELNDELYDALVTWSRERLDTQSDALFLTTKGAPKILSTRSIDHLIRTYGKFAKLKKTMNAMALRHTFAVRLFKTGIPKEQASTLLGITDDEALKRYADAATGQVVIEPIDHPLDQLDTRNPIKRFISKLFLPEPKEAKVLNASSTITVDPANVIFGRDKIIADITTSLNRTQSILIEGPLGIGKTHILKHLAHKSAYAIYISAPMPIKAMLTDICDIVSKDWKQELGSRASVQEMVSHLQQLRLLDPPILMIDNLHKLKISDIDLIITLMENYTILGATEKLKLTHNALWWKFKHTELKALAKADILTLIHHLAATLPVTNSDLLETQILNLANGSPLAVVDMIRQLSYEPVINSRSIREIYHDAGVQYRDWTSALIVLWAGIVLSRFIALGSHSFEGYILAGVGTSAFVVIRYAMGRIR